MGSKGSSGPSNVLIAGMAILLFGGVILGVGIHHLIRTGTCSSTGYSADYGPVPTCPSGTGAWMGFLFGGIICGIVGGFMVAGAGSLSISPIFFAIFGGIGFGSLSLVLDSKASSGSKTFGAIFGACFAIVGVGAGWAMLKAAYHAVQSPSGGSSGRAASVQSSSASFKSWNAQSTTKVVSNAFRTLTPSRSSSRSSSAGDPGAAALDQIAKLSDLHKSGVLTDDEFAKEKAKLLGEL